MTTNSIVTVTLTGGQIDGLLGVFAILVIGCVIGLAAFIFIGK